MWKNTFNDTDIPMFPSLGNHDVWPVNVEEFTGAGENPSIQRLSNSWMDPQWLSE
jgi:hypothetical protein